MRDRSPERGGRDRMTPVLVLLAAMLLGIAARLVWIQTVDAGELSARAEAQRLRDTIIPARRGAILDRDGGQLARTVDARTIYAVPREVKDATGTAAALAGVLGGDPGEYLKRLRRDSNFVYMARKADLDRASAVEALGIKGIEFVQDSRRTYPSGNLACQVLGFVGVDDGGLAGIEHYYDGLLSGTPGRVMAERDRFGRVLPGGVTDSVKPIPGKSITLTIDKDIQYEAQVALSEAVSKFKAKSGSVLVMDPRTGEIYAMASWPYFDPNRFSQARQASLRNRVISDAYEPGSTIKSFTAAAVIDLGLHKPESMFDLPPTLKVGDRTVHESHPRGAVRWSLTDIVTKSSNIGAVRLGLELGKKRIYDYFARFGLTEKTGVDYPGEAKGWLPPPSRWSQSSIGNVPFGQGISMTVLQLGRAYCALANGGRLVTPHFLRSESGAATEPAWPSHEVVPPATAATMRTMLAAVVSDGTGSSARVSGYQVAGKTGTAQKARVGGVGYVEGAYVASFAGFLPASDPRVMIIVTIDQPTKGFYGGTVAAPTFSRLARFTVGHLGIPPARVRRKTGALGNGAASGLPGKGADVSSVLESTSPVR